MTGFNVQSFAVLWPVKAHVHPPDFNNDHQEWATDNNEENEATAADTKLRGGCPLGWVFHLSSSKTPGAGVHLVDQFQWANVFQVRCRRGN